jgi:hypothetical protein
MFTSCENPLRKFYRAVRAALHWSFCKELHAMWSTMHSNIAWFFGLEFQSGKWRHTSCCRVLYTLRHKARSRDEVAAAYDKNNDRMTKKSSVCDSTTVVQYSECELANRVDLNWPKVKASPYRRGQGGVMWLDTRTSNVIGVNAGRL